MCSVLAIHVVELISTHQGIVDFPHHIRDTIRRVEALVWISLTGIIRIGRDLPAAEIERFQPCLHLLDGLIACQRAERGDIRLVLKEPPETLCPKAGQSMFDVNRSS